MVRSYYNVSIYLAIVPYPLTNSKSGSCGNAKQRPNYGNGGKLWCGFMPLATPFFLFPRDLTSLFLLFSQYMDFGSLHDLIRNTTMYLTGEIILQVCRDVSLLFPITVIEPGSLLFADI
jgi:hypothetical protein